MISFAQFLILAAVASTGAQIGSQQERGELVVKKIEEARKGSKLLIPAFTELKGGTITAPSDMSAITKALRNCPNENAYLIDLYDADKNFVGTAINLKCSESKNFAAIFKFSSVGKLMQVTFLPDGLQMAPPSPVFDPSRVKQ